MILHQNLLISQQIINSSNLKLLSLQTVPNDEKFAMIAECARQLGLPRENFESLLTALATVMADTSFLAQLMAINSRINTLAEDN